MLALFLKFLPTLLALVVGVAGMMAVPVQEFIAAHPALASVLAAVATMLGHFLPSPYQPKPPVDL